MTIDKESQSRFYMLSENAKKVLDKHIEIFEKDFVDKFKKDMEERVYRRTKTFSSFHSSEGINSLSLEDFKDKIFQLWAFSGWVNKDWFFENTMKINAKNFPSIKDNIAKLCFSKEELEDKINTFLEETNGMGFAFISEILYLATDSQYPIYNQKAKTVLEQLGVNLKNNIPRGNKSNCGLIYSEFVTLYQVVLDYVSSKTKLIDTFEKLDTLFWLVNYSDDGVVTPLALKKHDDLTNDFSILVVKMGRKKKDFHQLKKIWDKEKITSFGFEDLKGYDPKKNNEYNYEYLKEIMQGNGTPEGRIKKLASYIKSFHNVRPGKDWVIAYFKSHLHGFGLVNSDYHVNENIDNNWNHSIGVDWIWLENPIRLPEYSRHLYRQSRHNSSVSIVDNPTAIRDFLAIVEEHGPEDKIKEIETGVQDQIGSESIEQVALNTFMSEERLTHIEHSLSKSSKNQVIFDGVPGTGKTFVAQELGGYLSRKEGKSVGDVKVVSCHGGMSFEYLFQGLAPKDDGRLKSEKGIIADFVEKAEDNENAFYVLVLDEINRANIPQVFGQMLYLLEYRGKDIELPYDGESISLPNNLLVIATMNSEDRSTGVLDFAFRRRFSHFRFDPDSNVLSKWLNKKYKNSDEVNISQVVDLFENLNKKLKEFDENFQVGHSYFMTNYPLSNTGIKNLWETEIIPLLEERFFHNKSIVGNEFKLEKFLQPQEIEEKLAS